MGVWDLRFWVPGAVVLVRDLLPGNDREFECLGFRAYSSSFLNPPK